MSRIILGIFLFSPFRDGLSARIVPEADIIAQCESLIFRTNFLEFSPVIHLELLFTVAILPSRVVAIFVETYGFLEGYKGLENKKIYAISNGIEIEFFKKGYKFNHCTFLPQDLYLI